MSFETVVDILQIIFADIILSGDNALVIGMAAAGLSPEFRKRAIMIGLILIFGQINPIVGLGVTAPAVVALALSPSHRELSDSPFIG